MSEYRQRQARALAQCQSDHPEVTAVLVSSPSYLRWISALDGWGFYTPQFALLHRQGAGQVRCEVVIRAMDVTAALRDTATVDAVHCYPDAVVDNPRGHCVHTTVAPLLHRLLGAGAVVGMDADSAFFRGRFVHELAAAGWGPDRCVDCTVALAAARKCKSATERALVRRAAGVSDSMMAAAVAAVRSARRRCDVALPMVTTQVQAGGWSAIPPIVSQGDQGGHATWDGEPIDPEATIRVELAGACRGYHAPLSRTLAPPGCRDLRAAAEQHRVLCVALAAGLRSLRPGVKAGAVHARVMAVLEAAGLSKDSRCGYSFGLGHCPDWGDGGFSITAGSAQQVPCDSAVHLILGCGDGWLVQASESCLVLEDGVELLCRTPRRVLCAEADADPDRVLALSPALYVPTLRMGLPVPASGEEAGLDWRFDWWAGGRREAEPGGADAGREMAAILALEPAAQEAQHVWWPERAGVAVAPPTPLRGLPLLAAALGLRHVHLKDETNRLGGRSFKMLGSVAAVSAALQRSPHGRPLLVTMSDGNHGHAVAAVGAALGLPAHVVLPENVRPEPEARLRALGAEVERAAGDYDEAVARAIRLCAETPDAVFVSDTCVDCDGDEWETGRATCLRIAAGYLAIFREVEEEATAATAPTHVLVQTGVGGLAAACACWIHTSLLWSRLGVRRPKLVLVEAADTACYTAGLRKGAPVRVSEEEAEGGTCMEGMACPSPSAAAWPVLCAMADACVSIGDQFAVEGLRVLQESYAIPPRGRRLHRDRGGRRPHRVLRLAQGHA
jgi:threonine dehydratase/Xaa-Pro aminopeptidase